MKIALWTIYLWLLVAVFSTAATAGDGRDWPALPQQPHLAASIKLGEGGRLCAVGPLMAYSAKHVWDAHGSATWRNGDHDVPLQVFLFKGLDLVRVMSPEPFPAWAALRPGAPAIGDELHALGPTNGERSDPTTLWFTRVMGPWKIWDEELLAAYGPSPAGSSGGCWFDAQGRVVGIEVGIGLARISRVDAMLSPITFISPLWGGWAKK